MLFSHVLIKRLLLISVCLKLLCIQYYLKLWC